MNNWGNDHFSMSNIMGMHSMMPNMMGSMHMVPQMMGMMMPDLNNTLDGTQANADSMNSVETPLIGPVLPEGLPGGIVNNSHNNINNEVGLTKNERKEKEYPRERGKDRSDYRRNNERDRSRRSRSRDKDRYDRSDRNKSTSRWGRSTGDDHEKPALLPTPGAHYNPMGNMIMPGMMQVGNMVPNMMGQQSMDMANMAPMMQGMVPNMMSSITDQNMMLINQQMMATQQLMQEGVLMQNQPIFVGNAVLLPPLPNTETPSRREKPLGCRTIFVGGFPSNVNEDILKMIFQRFGEIVDVKIHKQGFCHIRFDTQNSVEYSFAITGYRFKYNEQSDNEATTLFIDYALSREDQNEYDQLKAKREHTPPRIEPLTPANLSVLSEKIKNEEKFAEAAPTLTAWLERGECNKRNANTFYSLIQATNNQVRRLSNDKMQLDDEFMNLKSSIKDKYVHVLMQ